jgi:hypothetical protein
MAFEQLQSLGEERFGKILNQLMRGASAQGLARTLQRQPPEGWGVFQDVAEKTLTQQLNRLRLAVAEGAFGSAHAKRLQEGHKPHIDLLNGVSVNALTRMEELAETKRSLVLVLLAKATAEERTWKSVNDATEVYRKILLDIQKMRFDLGLDEFKGPVGTTSVRSATQTTTTPDGSTVQRQVFEAVSTIERIFNARRIPHIIPRDRD